MKRDRLQNGVVLRYWNIFLKKSFVCKPDWVKRSSPKWAWGPSKFSFTYVSAEHLSAVNNLWIFAFISLSIIYSTNVHCTLRSVLGAGQREYDAEWRRQSFSWERVFLSLASLRIWNVAWIWENRQGPFLVATRGEVGWAGRVKGTATALVGRVAWSAHGCPVFGGSGERGGVAGGQVMPPKKP